MIEMAFLKMATTAALSDLRHVASETAASAGVGARTASLISEIASLGARILTSLYQRGARNIAEQWHRLDEAPSNDDQLSATNSFDLLDD